MKSDVKSVRVTATGAVFAGRTRLRGIILASDGGGAGTGAGALCEEEQEEACAAGRDHQCALRRWAQGEL